jgi:hydrogenase expression/formation protein HypC
MCLGIPGQLVALDQGHPHLATVDVSGVTRTINVGLLEDEALQPGDWVLIHVGFAMSKIDEQEGAGVAAAHGAGLRRQARSLLVIGDSRGQDDGQSRLIPERAIRA